VIHLYAISEGPLELTPAAGVGGAPLETRDLDGLTLVISRHDGALAADEAAVLQHAGAVDAVAATGATVLPARFERSYRDENALVAAVRERAAAVRTALENVAGCVELGVRAVDSTPEPVVGGREDPAAYMRARLARVQRLEELATASVGL
jgi:Gas vesicle synthesis protein GvpL/GvpF